METATNVAGNRPETSGTQPTSGNAQPSSSGDGGGFYLIYLSEICGVVIERGGCLIIF